MTRDPRATPSAPGGRGAGAGTGADRTGEPPGATGRPGTGDPGLQPERTRLAWHRTSLACTVVVVLAVKAALRTGPTAGGLLVCALCLAGWLGLLVVARRRVRALTTAVPPPPDPRLAATAVLCTLVLAGCAAVLVVG